MMNRIKTDKWNEYKIGDIFTIVKPFVLHTRQVEECPDGINYVVRTKFNNGIKYQVKKIDNIEPSPKGVITFGSENSIFFYQEHPFYSGRDIYYIDTKEYSKYTCLFVISCLKQITEKYSYNFGLFPELIKEEKIKLPSKDNKPDWKYMDEYMREKEAPSIKKIKKITTSIKKEKRLINHSSWQDFKIKDLFNIHPTKSYKMNNASLIDDGINPVIVNSAFNNGVGGYTTQETTETKNILTFSDTVDANTIFYQEEDFVGYPHVQGVYPKKEYKNKMNKHVLMFICSVFKSAALSKAFDYGNKFRRDIALELSIKLPSKNNEPDWEYMEEYMKNIEIKCKEKLKTI